MSGTAGKEKKQEVTILLAEDDHIVRAMVREILVLDGYDVITAADGQEAYEEFQKHPDGIDLIVTDVVMPRMNGKELGRQCRGSSPRINILFMSGYVDNRLNPEEDLKGAADFIAKPFRPADLLQKVERLLGGSNTVSEAIGN